MTPDISIIMPLYNAERFLEEALISVSKQTFQEYELICINDGSDDNTVNIVRKFQSSDSRIKMLSNKEHSGAAVARNKGIKAARGKYLIFLDGDDIFDEELLALTYEKAEETCADIVIFEANHVPSTCIYNRQVVEHSTNFKSKFCQHTLSIKDIKVSDFLLYPGNLGTKLFRKEFIKHQHLEFQNLSCENDTYFVMMAFFLVKRVIWLDSGRVMLYVRDHDTDSRISSDRDPMCVYYAMSKVRDELERRNLFDEMSQMFYYRTFFFLLDGLRSTKTMENRTKFFDFLVREGFDKLFGCHNRQNGIDQYLQDKTQEFSSLGVREGWENLVSFYDVFLKDNLKEIGRLFQNEAGEMRRVGVWGVGENGKKFLAFCRRYDLPIAMVIDRDETKCGTYSEGYCVQTPQAVVEADVIISTPSAGYEAIKERARIYKANVEVIDLNTYICCN